MSFPVKVCLMGAGASFYLTVRLWNLKLRERPPASRAHLSLEQRQHKVRIGTWIVFAMGWMYLAGAILLSTFSH